jgi:WD40 repeat protein
LLRTLNEDDSSIRSVSFSENGKWLVYGVSNYISDKHSIKIWDAESWQLQRSFEVDNVSYIALSPNDQLVATPRQMWDMSGRRLPRLDFEGYPLAFSPDGVWLASSGDNFSVKLWDVASMQLQNVF